MVLTGEALRGEGGGLDAIAVPISTPGYDAAPYLTATCCITADPGTGVQNMGTDRLPETRRNPGFVAPVANPSHH